MSGSQKKVIVRKFSREYLRGYLHASNFILEGNVALLDLTGKLVPIVLAEVKWICFVRDFNSGELDHPERLLRKRFSSRPRSQGLWLRISLKDSDSIEGMAQNDLSLLDQAGFFLVPPDTRSNTQRIFLPRPAISELEVLAVVRPVRIFPPLGQESLQAAELE